MKVLGKILRILGIVLLGLTAVFHILGGAGTTCAAFGAENYDSMAGIIEYKWLYQLYVMLNIAVGIAMIWALVNLVRGKHNAYRNAVLLLILGLVISGAHMFTSQALRGASAPNNMRVYVNFFTLVLFLVYRIPGIWKWINWEGGKGSGAGAAAGMAMIVGGLLTLTVQLWAGATHTWGGINFADVWHTQLLLIGGVTLVFGIVTLAWALIPRVEMQVGTAEIVEL